MLRAREARENAYAPYSGYQVGAAIEDARGDVYVGCNVENISFPVGICAERAAVAAMVSSGGKEIRKIALSTRDGGTPCGLCLQTLLEFSPDPSKVQVICGNDKGETNVKMLKELLPFAFRSSQVERTEES